MTAEQGEENHPVVFISYSHDTKEHKKWVANFASELVEKGVEVLFDQWDLSPGDDVPKFMEQSVAKADRVLMICSEAYVRKADDGKGGVGYETMIVTGQLVKDLGKNKFIPIIRQTSNEKTTPACVSTRLYIDFSEDGMFAEKMEDLLRELHSAPLLPKPELGKNPFHSEKAGPSDVGTPTEPFRDPDALVTRSRQLIRADAFPEWRKFVREVRKPVSKSLLEWEAKWLQRKNLKTNDLVGMLLEALPSLDPMVIPALLGVESCNSGFNNQVAVLDELLTPKDWIRSGLSVVVSAPDAFAFAYQAMHGAVCLETNQLSLALHLVRSSVSRMSGGRARRLFDEHTLIACPESLHSHGIAWDFLTKLPEACPWLLELFGDLDGYHGALWAYYLALNVAELADALAAGKSEMISGGQAIRLDLPLEGTSFAERVQRRAWRLLTQDPHQLEQVWLDVGVKGSDMAEHWDSWIEKCEAFARDPYRRGFLDELPHQELFKEPRISNLAGKTNKETK